MDSDTTTKRIHVTLDVHLHLHRGAMADGDGAEVIAEPTADPAVEAMLNRLASHGSNGVNVRAAYEGLSGLGLTPRVARPREGGKPPAYLLWSRGESGAGEVYLYASRVEFTREAAKAKVASLPGAIQAREVRFSILTPEGVQQALAAVRAVIS